MKLDLNAFQPYQLTQQDKEKNNLPLFNELVNHHLRHCSEYANIIKLLYNNCITFSNIEAIPFLPVNPFKELKLSSIPENLVFKTLYSSGTTSTIPSQIILDESTSHRQTLALASIMQSILGKKRLPTLIIDSPSILKDPKNYSARGAGIVGLSHFGRDHFYALDENMQLDKTGLKKWLQKHQSEEILIFGFTYIIWQFLVKESQKKEFNFTKAILLHSGGWKKLKEEFVSNNAFKTELLNRFGLTKVHNFYGMVEQVGNIYIECEKGNLHCPWFADLIIRDQHTWQPLLLNQEGIIQVLSLLPTSYPGHSLLTEDIGYLMGIDDCVCGRKGKFFQVIGRVPQAEARGCGDTFAINKENR